MSSHFPPPLSIYKILLGMAWRFTFGKIGVDKPLCSVFPQLYHLSTKRLCSVVFVLLFLDFPSSFFFGLFVFLAIYWHIEAVNMATHLSLIGDSFVSQGRMYTRWLIPSLSWGFLLVLFFPFLCVTSPPLEALAFFSIWKVKNSKKVKFFVE